MYNQQVKKAFIFTAIIVGLFGIVLQFILMLQSRQTGLAEAVIRFFGFFTIISNCMVLLFFVGHLFPAKKYLYAFVNKNEVATAVTIYIIVVGAVYQTILRNPIPLKGLHRVADDILHAFIPLLMAGFWLIFISSKKINANTIPYWLIYPAAYLIYTLIRGSIVNYYPYPFVAVNNLGYSRVLFNSGMLVIFFLGISFLFAAFANWRNKKSLNK